MFSGVSEREREIVIGDRVFLREREREREKGKMNCSHLFLRYQLIRVIASLIGTYLMDHLFSSNLEKIFGRNLPTYDSCFSAYFSITRFILYLIRGQSFKASTLVNDDSRVLSISDLQVITTLES